MTIPNYSKYIKNSFELTKTNKWLWVFAALVCGGGGFSSGSQFSDALNDLKVKDKNPSDIIKEIPKTTANVLGDSTSALLNWVRDIPPEKWLLLSLLILALVVICILTILIITNWARGSLIKGIDIASKGHRVTLSNSSPEGFKYLGDLIKFSILIMASMLLLIGAIPLLWTIVFLILINISVLKTIWIILGVLSSPILIFIFIVLSTLVVVYGERLIVLKGLKPVDALKKGVMMSRNTLLPGILMGVINKVVGFAVGFAELILLGIAIGVPVYLAFRAFEKNPGFSILLGSLAALSFLIFLFAGSVIRAALVTFGFSNWNQFFNDSFESNEKEGGRNE